MINLKTKTTKKTQWKQQQKEKNQLVTPKPENSVPFKIQLSPQDYRETVAYRK